MADGRRVEPKALIDEAKTSLKGRGAPRKPNHLLHAPDLMTSCNLEFIVSDDFFVAFLTGILGGAAAAQTREQGGSDEVSTRRRTSNEHDVGRKAGHETAVSGGQAQRNRTTRRVESKLLTWCRKNGNLGGGGVIRNKRILVYSEKTRNAHLPCCRCCRARRQRPRRRPC